ncbi:MAG: VWA containing CoxE family protein [Candidatus Frackibacter sp. T328-2]|nr:MAG: VWA containing CoxE family protein [Candidatus Frackibacter sp. T328-2]
MCNLEDDGYVQVDEEFEEAQKLLASSLDEGLPDYVENNIVKFIQILRNLGIRISLAESIEALEALKLVDIIKKEEVRTTLCSLLVKDSYEKKIFDKAFDSFFVSLEDKVYQQRIRKEKMMQQEEAKKEAEELKFKKESVVDEDKDEEVPLSFTEDQKEIYSKLDPEIKEKIKKFIEESFPGHLSHSSHAQPMLERMVSGTLNYWKNQLRNQDEGDEQKQKIEAKMTGDLDMDVVIENVISSLQQEEESLITQDMKRISDEELPKVTMIIKKLSHRLATKISRRFQQSKKTGKLDLRRTIRKNIKYGGAMLELEYKTKKIKKPEFLLICDVSDSMARYATFVLQFMYGIASAVRNMESFIFSEDLERVTEFFTSNLSFEETMAKIISHSKQWGKTTNFNQALKTFRSQYVDLLSPETVVFIMSDTKTIELDEAVMNLRRIKRQVKEIVWLNTLPKSEWPELNSVQEFKGIANMLECYTIKHLKNSLKIQTLT